MCLCGGSVFGVCGWACWLFLSGGSCILFLSGKEENQPVEKGNLTMMFAEILNAMLTIIAFAIVAYMGIRTYQLLREFMRPVIRFGRVCIRYGRKVVCFTRTTALPAAQSAAEFVTVEYAPQIAAAKAGIRALGAAAGKAITQA